MNRILKSFLAVSILVLLMIPSFASSSWEIEEFENRVEGFAKNLLEGKKFDTVKEKEAILADLLGTVYRSVFEKKLRIIGDVAYTYSRKLDQKAYNAKNEKEYIDWQTRDEELWDLSRKRNLVKEDFEKAEKIELNTGVRPEMKLKFKITKAKWEPEKKNAKIKNFLSELRSAEKTLKGAIDAINSKNIEKFSKYWIDKEQLDYSKDKIEMKQSPDKLGYSDISTRFRRLTERQDKNGLKWEILPTFMRADLKNSTKTLESSKIVRAYLKEINDKGEISKEDVWLVKEKGKYRIKSW